MNDKVKKSLANVRRELRGIPQDALDKFVASLQRDSYSAHLNAHHGRHSQLGRGSHCSKTDLLLLSGREITNNAGKATLLIDSLLCGVVNEGLSSQFFLMFTQPDFVATPVSSTPSFVTVTTSSTKVPPQPGTADRDGNPIDQPTLSDVKVDVTTWKPDGTPAANTTFSWICTVEAVRSPFLLG